MKGVHKKKVYRIMAVVMAALLLIQPLSPLASAVNEPDLGTAATQTKVTQTGAEESNPVSSDSVSGQEISDGIEYDEGMGETEEEQEVELSEEDISNLDSIQALSGGTFGYDGTSPYDPGTENNPYLIEDLTDLTRLATYVNGRNTDSKGKLYADLSYRLTADITISSSEWVPIGIFSNAVRDWNTNIESTTYSSSRKPFSGVFDGDGHNISGLRTGSTNNATYGYTSGMFGLVDGAVIKNLNIKEATITGNGSNGILVGYSIGNTQIDNCHVSGSVTTNTTYPGAGGLIGFLTLEQANANPSVKNCTTDIQMTSTQTYGRVGGLIGYVRGGTEEGYTTSNRNTNKNTLLIENCSAKGSINSYYYNIGGLIGHIYMRFSDNKSIFIRDCKTDVAITTTRDTGYCVGGIVGDVNISASSYSNFEMTDCSSYGNITTTGYYGYYVGGVIGSLRYTDGTGTDGSAKIINCHSYADSVKTTGTSGYYVGGLIGFTETALYASRTKILIEECSSISDVSSKSYYVGGLIGYSEVTMPTLGISARPNSYGQYNANGDLNATNSSYTTIRNCYATGNVEAGAAKDAAAGTNVGGLIGHCHAGNNLPDDAILIENCYATGDVSITVSTGINAGGLVGRPSKNVTIKNSYSTGDVYGPLDHVGGFIGYSEGNHDLGNYVTVLNCFSTGNAVGGRYGVGGFIGLSQQTFIKNCYSVGSAYNTYTPTGTVNYTGSFIGWLTYGGRVENSYGTGHVNAYNITNRLGGFIGFLDGLASTFPLYINDCLYDTTTTKRTSGIGYQSASGSGYLTLQENGRTVNDVKGYKTSEVINQTIYNTTYSNWNLTNNVCAVPSSKGSGTSNSPWYIDSDITYPYLYYQADGFNTTVNSNSSTVKPSRLDDNSKGDGYLNNITVNSKSRNYYLGSLGNSGTVGGPYTAVGQNRADYNSTTALAALNSQYMATTAGAVRAYFPYTHGKSQSDYNSYQYWFDGGAVYIPKTGVYSHTSNSLYSLGAISETNIVAFTNGPFAMKDSDRFEWVNGDKDTYTNVGQTVEYTVEVANYSTKAHWKNVVMTDPLAYGVTLIDGEVYADYGNGEFQIQYWDGSGAPPSTIPYYTYTLGEAGSIYENRYIVEVVLGDFAVAEINANNMVVEGCTVKFKVLVGREAATDFKADGSWDGENIRNRGIVTGTMEFIDDTPDVDIEIDIDDNNEDPVYDTYLIKYNSNYDLNGESNPADTEIIKDYVLRDGSESHVLLSNEDQNDGNDYVGFNFSGYEFSGWFYYGTDGTRVDVDPGDEIKNVDRDITIFAKWIPSGTTFEFNKVDSRGENLAGAKFELYIWKKAGAPGENDLVDADSVADGDWKEVKDYTSTDNNPISLAFTTSGYYQLVEISAPDGYQKSDVQWRFEVDLTDSESPIVKDPVQVKGADSTIFVDIEKNNDKWILLNYSILELEFLKVSNAYYHSDGETYSEILTGASFELYIWAGSSKPGDEDLVTEESIEADDWIKYSDAATDSEGKVSFDFIDTDGIYQLVETEAPEFFQMPSGQWRFEIKTGYTIEEVIQSITAVKGMDGAAPPAFKVMDSTELGGEYDGQLALVNFKEYYLPAMGGTGIQIFMIIGTLLIAAGIIWASVRKRRRLAV